MNTLTVRQKILLAASECSERSERFRAGELVLRAWQLFPESFSLDGTANAHPDSNRVLAKLAGAEGLRGLGWLELVDPSTYRVTTKGARTAKQLRALTAPAPELKALRQVDASERRTKTRTPTGPRTKAPSITEADLAELRALERNGTLRRFLLGSPLTFAGACEFWGLSQKHPRRVRDRLHEVEQLLERVTRAFDGSAVDVRLPKLSVCYGLLNLHRLLSSRFARELDALAASTSGGAAT